MICKEHADLNDSGRWWNLFHEQAWSIAHMRYGVMISNECSWIICTLVQVGDCWRYALEANNGVVIGISHIVHNSFIQWYNCIKRKHWCTCGCKQTRVPSMPLRRLAHLGQLMIEVSRSWTMRSLDNEVISLGEWYDGYTHVSIVTRSSHLIQVAMSKKA